MVHGSSVGWGHVDSASNDGHAGPLRFRPDPRPMTSSISCSAARCAAKVPLKRGRLNENGAAELSVTIPSYSPPGPMVPSGNMAGTVFNPTARPFALDGAMFVDNGCAGRLAFALMSLMVFASALKALIKSFHDIVYMVEELVARTPGGKGVPPG